MTTRKTALLLVGFSLFWTGSLASRANLASMGDYLPDTSLAFRVLLSLVAFVLFLFVCRKPFWKPFNLSVAALTAISAFLAIAANGSDMPEALRWAAAFTLAAARPLSTCFWTAWLIAFDRRSFPRAFLAAALINLALTALLLMLPELVREKAAYLMLVASGFILPIMAAPGFLSEKPHFSLSKGQGRHVALFVAVRLLIGVLNSLMVVVIVSLHGAGAGEGWAQSILALGIMLAAGGALVWLLKVGGVQANAVVGVLAVIPLFAAAPLAARGLESLSSMMSVFYWFTAFAFSNIHLYRNKWLCGATPLVVVSGAVVLTSAGDIAVTLLPLSTFIASLDPVARIAPMMAVSYLASLAALLLLAATLNRKDEKAQAPSDRALLSLAKRYDLTPREREVFALLAKGYSRRYISEQLVVSQATVKTHINNIYQKMGINKHDSLLALVEEERAGF